MKGIKKKNKQNKPNPGTKQDKPNKFSGKTRSPSVSCRIRDFRQGGSHIRSANPAPSEIMDSLQNRALEKNNPNKTPMEF